MKNLIKKALTGIVLFTPALAMAQPGNVTGSNIKTLNGLWAVVDKIVNYLVGAFYVVAVLYIFYAAFLFLISGGDEEKLKTAKTQLLYSVIAIAVALLAGTMQFIVKDILS
ncbi:MAG: hypothetical protein Q7S73_02420 [bacterium]|nr:hypothetical protein [bacterium]